MVCMGGRQGRGEARERGGVVCVCVSEGVGAACEGRPWLLSTSTRGRERICVEEVRAPPISPAEDLCEGGLGPPPCRAMGHCRVHAGSTPDEDLVPSPRVAAKALFSLPYACKVR